MPNRNLSVVTLRMTGEFHERLKVDAIAESLRTGRVVSLNELCVDRLRLYPALRDDLHETQEERDRLLRRCQQARIRTDDRETDGSGWKARAETLMTLLGQLEGLALEDYPRVYAASRAARAECAEQLGKEAAEEAKRRSVDR